MEFDKQQFEDLLHLLYKVVNSLEGQPLSDPRVKDCEKFAFKLLAHSTSAYHLWNDTPINYIKESSSITDNSSILVLTRAAFEAYLLFHYIFVEPDFSSDAFDFRHAAWQLRSYILRQKPIISELDDAKTYEIEKKLEKERDALEHLRRVVRSTQVFKGEENPNKRKNILKGIDWRPGWKELAKNAGFGEVYADKLYSFMSEHAHSGLLFAIHLENNAPDDNREVSEIGLNCVELCIAKMVRDYTSLFPYSKKAAMEDSNMWEYVLVLSSVKLR